MMKVAGATVTLVGGGLAVVPSTAQAATFTASTEGELAQAIVSANNAAGPDTITIAAGTINLTADLPRITEELTITGAGEGVTILDGGDKYAAFYATSAVELLTISAMTIRNMYNTEGGPAVRAEGAIALSSVTFHSNQAFATTYSNPLYSGEGGAVKVDQVDVGDDVTITDCTFTDNLANGASVGPYYVIDSEGGAVFIDVDQYNPLSTTELTSASDVTITDSLFDGNYSNDDGGAMLVQIDGGNLTITGSTFENNGASSDGGAVAVDQDTGNVVVDTSTFNYNSAGSDGGAIYLDDSDLTLTVSNSDFFSNTAGSDGGAIELDGATSLTVTDSTFTSNYSESDGGAIDIDVLGAPYTAGLMTITDTTFQSNSSGDEGGALYLDDGDIVATLTNATFSSNTASERGGAIAIDGAELLDVVGSTFTTNSAQDGGAIYADSNTTSSITVTESTFTGNFAYEGSAYPYSQGGAIRSRRPLFVSDSTFVENESQGEGGAIFVEAQVYIAPAAGEPLAFTVSDSTFTANQSSGTDGGAIWMSNTEASVTNSTFTDNFTFDYGGAIWAGGSGSLSVSGSTFASNFGYLSGGAIFANYSRSSTLTVTASTFTNNTAYEEVDARGGAIFSERPLDVSMSTFSGNRAGDDGGAIFVEASVYVAAPEASDVPVAFTISNSTLSGNVAVDDGGAIFAYQTVSEIRQSTIYGNTSYEYGGAVVAYNTYLTVSNSTIVGNDATTYAGIWAYSSYVQMDNTILWGNTDDAGNVQIDGTGSVVTGANNITDVDPMLNPLANNGGVTMTMLPKVGSPAFDTGNNAIKPFETDQRGAERIYKDVIDIGAVEAQADERSEVLPPTGSGAEGAAWLAAMLTGLGAAFTAATRRRGARQR